MNTPKPVVLMILDGWALSQEAEGNAIVNSNKPYYDQFSKQYPATTLAASGLSVGLPEGQMGNSEVGHLNIGAGRVVYQELTRITKSISDGDFFDNTELNASMENCIQNNSALHLMGLLSDGGVHSHLKHLFALVELAKKRGLTELYIHAILDGRDVPPRSAAKYIEELEQKLKEIGLGKIATVSGRYYAMDRDKRWERTSLAYSTYVEGQGYKVETAMEALNTAYDRDENDEFVKPTVIVGGKKIEDQDSLIFFNFRPDRARQITRAFVDGNLEGLERKAFPKVHYTCFTQYDETLEVPVAFKPQNINNTLGEVLAKANKNQLRIAETEKYAHVTFFFNGGVEAPNDKEERLLIPSPKVATYDLKPEMSAYEVTEEVIKAIENGNYDFILINYANPDMVGHTGIMEAAVKACEVVDDCISQVIPKVLEKNGVVMLTSDHGNADQMLDLKTRKAHTAHTSNPVPLIVAGLGDIKLTQGALCDIAPTVLKIMGLEQPVEMSGKTLF
ncbi:2,3-bisphosphoglycerate-independent phosphoglycerate mutase [Alkalicella caledoniensis]|uniref:2,3-bisphosphoglycerate-independent phosphoglycerate mutase n=1 Tax=Alkalicella caledoniensis TaxID=2731377 RepID=A0A7G9W6S5_ALKCA|nr:2,3-bisphosphoglycerate-independent phosphoglycerate mutase [Alkalicella caledoniensis]QNO14387.1 2,3-bisphosphoglycerate-independent phosphoglycerate mutase [Alkalicella caledoniensis]